MTRQKKKVVVFDFDGTIVNSMDAFADIAASVMPKHLPIDAATARRRYLETSGIPFFQQLEVIFPGNPANKNVADEFERIKVEKYFSRPVFDDAASTLAHLKERGFVTAVSSNNYQELVDRFVGRADISFDIVLGFRPNFEKGADHFTHIMRETGSTKDDIAFVGDSLKDGERAGEFGIDFIGKEGIFSGSEFKEQFPDAKVISTLAELKKIL